MSKTIALVLGVAAATFLALAAVHAVTAQAPAPPKVVSHCVTCHGGSQAVDKAAQDVAAAKKALTTGDSATAAKKLNDADTLLRNLAGGLAATGAHRAWAAGVPPVAKPTSAVSAKPAASAS